MNRQPAHDRYNSEQHPARPFGSALRGGDGGHIERCPRIGRTIKPQSAGPCKVCGERRWFCDCEDDETPTLNTAKDR